jgi:hypothetical protein
MISVMLRLLQLLVFIHAGLCSAQAHDFDAERTGFNSLTQSGKLVTLIVQPGDRQIRFEIVAKEAAKLKFADDGVEASWGQGDQRQNLKVVRVKDPTTQKEYFVFDRPATPIQNLQIKVKSGKTKEQFDLPRIE